MVTVVSFVDDDFELLTQRAMRQKALADLIELRLDRIGNPGVEAMRRCFQALGKPVIISCNGSEAYGDYAGSLEELCALYHDAAEAGARFVDIDWRLSLDLGEVQAPCHRIVSRHELEGTPEDLDEVLEELQAVLFEGDVTKLVTHASCTEDGLRLLQWLRSTKGVVSFCAGEAGSFTRILAPIFGSPFTYCAPAMVPGEEAQAPTAPGQIRISDLLAQLPPGGISQETAIFGVVGNPAKHSWSPWVHGMALKAAHLDAVFVALEPTDFELFHRLTQDENYRGFSITAPFKEVARSLVSLVDEAGKRTGAVNTYVRDGLLWKSSNTDVGAVRETLELGLQMRGGEQGLGDCQTLVLGAGGAARAAIWAVRSLGGRVSVAARRPEAAQALAKELDCQAILWDAIPDLEYDVLVHTTPLGSLASAETVGQLALPADWIRAGSVVLDAVYRPIKTPLLEAAHAKGCVAVPGGEWFVRQAISQFKTFTQSDPDEELMRKAFEHAHEIHSQRDARA